MANTVLVKGDPIVKEAVASEAITPGHLIEFGGSNDVQKHATAGGNARKTFMREQDYIGQDIDTDCAAGDRIPYLSARQGDEVRALLGSGTSEYNISKGDALESDGTGKLQKHGTAATGDSHNVVGFAMEAVDNSGGSSPVRITVEVA